MHINMPMVSRSMVAMYWWMLREVGPFRIGFPDVWEVAEVQEGYLLDLDKGKGRLVMLIVEEEIGDIQTRKGQGRHLGTRIDPLAMDAKVTIIAESHLIIGSIVTITFPDVIQ